MKTFVILFTLMALLVNFSWASQTPTDDHTWGGDPDKVVKMEQKTYDKDKETNKYNMGGNKRKQYIVMWGWLRIIHPGLFWYWYDLLF